ncbi:hypothetical protein Tco_0426586 [Tanacetum coccineum]
MKVDMVLWFGLINNNGISGVGDYFHFPMFMYWKPFLATLSVQLMKKMLQHKLEIEIDGVGNDMTYAE